MLRKQKAFYTPTLKESRPEFSAHTRPVLVVHVFFLTETYFTFMLLFLIPLSLSTYMYCKTTTLLHSLLQQEQTRQLGTVSFHNLFLIQRLCLRVFVALFLFQQPNRFLSLWRSIFDNAYQCRLRYLYAGTWMGCHGNSPHLRDGRGFGYMSLPWLPQTSQNNTHTLTLPVSMFCPVFCKSVFLTNLSKVWALP